TPATAHELDVSGNLVQATGAVGDDLTSAAANDVDVYHFQVSGPGHQALVAEVFAHRIGSPLNAGLSLFRRDGDGLHLVAVNDNTFNPTPASPGSPEPTPLAADPAVFAGLTAGDYYLVVSASGNL